MAKRMFSCKLVCGFLLALVLLVQSDESCNLDFERTLQAMFTPQEQPTTQMRALRRYLLRILQNMVAKAEEVEGWNTYAYPKRNLEALARAGYLHTLPEEDNQTETQDKRSFASLVKNGQLPVHHYADEDGNKRSSESLASNNELKREIQKMLEELYTNAALAQDIYAKRNIEKLARDGGYVGKRNVAALLKNDRYLSHMLQQSGEDKRNIASVKAGYKPRYKREIGSDDGVYYGDDSEYPLYDTTSGYDSAVEELLEGQRSQKRFLGSVARTGWYSSPKTSSITRTSQYAPPGKRHIGSLARLGWLPAIRNVRRFSRSGRSSIDGPCRTEWLKTSKDGQDEDYIISENSIPLDSKRFHPVPAMWKVPLQTFNY